MTFKYEDPLDRGYKQFKLTKKQHNELFPKRKIKWHNKYEYFYNEHCVILHRFYNKKSIIFATITFPIFVLCDGLFNIKESWNDLKRLYNQKKYGSFSGDTISKGSDTCDEVMKIIG